MNDISAIEAIHDDLDSGEGIRSSRPASANQNDFWYGGLNYQIEHHLFPSMPRHNLKEAQRVIKAFCREHEVSYYETSVAQSYQEILSFLHGIGAPLRQKTHDQNDEMASFNREGSDGAAALTWYPRSSMRGPKNSRR